MRRPRWPSWPAASCARSVTNSPRRWPAASTIITAGCWRSNSRGLRRAEADIATLDKQIVLRLQPYATQMELLRSIPGVDWATAAIIIAEIGVEMSVWRSAGHLSAWAGACPGNNQSGGKNKPAGSRKGNIYLKTALCNAAIGASRKSGSFFKSKYGKLKARRGGGRAALAIGHKLLVCVYHMLSTGTVYKDLGGKLSGQARHPARHQPLRSSARKTRLQGHPRSDRKANAPSTA